MEMTTLLFVGCAILAIVIIALQFHGNAILKAMKTVKKTHDPKPVIDAIDNAKTQDLPTAYNACIKTLWDAYDRETATRLVGALLERNDTAKISQYWLRTVMEVEPEIARKLLGEDFIKTHFHEEIAAGTGSGCGGSCGKKKCASGSQCKSCKA